MSFDGYATINGTEATFRRVTLGVYDTEAGTKAETTADVTVHGILQQYRADEIAENIDTNDRKYLIPAGEITDGDPTTEDRLIIDSVTYEIVTVMRIEQHGAAHIYNLQIRRTV